MPVFNWPVRYQRFPARRVIGPTSVLSTYRVACDSASTAQMKSGPWPRNAEPSLILSAPRAATKASRKPGSRVLLIRMSSAAPVAARLCTAAISRTKTNRMDAG